MTDQYQSLKNLLESGDKEGAIKQLAAILGQNPRNIDAWLLLAKLMDNNARKADCYRQVLRIDPNHAVALKGLQAFSDPPKAASPVPPMRQNPRPSATSTPAPSFTLQRSPVSNFITLACPSCGNKLDITPDIDRFACSACGNEHIVRRSGGMVTLQPIVAGLNRISHGVDRTSSELALSRLSQEIKELNTVIEAEQKRILEAQVRGIVFLVSGLILLAAKTSDSTGTFCLTLAIFFIIAGVVFLAAASNKQILHKAQETLTNKQKEYNKHYKNVNQ